MMSEETPAQAPQELNPDRAVKLYFSEPEWIFKTGMGGMFFAASILVLASNPLLLPVTCLLWALLEGYSLRAIRGQAKDAENKLPNWNDWLDLMISGLTWIAIWSGQLFFLLSVFTILLLLGDASEGLHAASPQFTIWATTSFCLMTFLGVCVSFLSAYSMANFAVKEEIKAGFGFPTIFKRLRNRPMQMIQAWLLSVGLFWLAVLVPFVSVFGMIFIPTTVFMARVLSAKLLGQAWAGAENSG